jgi:hypothetical protein
LAGLPVGGLLALSAVLAAGLSLRRAALARRRISCSRFARRLSTGVGGLSRAVGACAWTRRDAIALPLSAPGIRLFAAGIA